METRSLETGGRDAGHRDCRLLHELQNRQGGFADREKTLRAESLLRSLHRPEALIRGPAAVAHGYGHILLLVSGRAAPDGSHPAGPRDIESRRVAHRVDDD